MQKSIVIIHIGFDMHVIFFSLSLSLTHTHTHTIPVLCNSSSSSLYVYQADVSKIVTRHFEQVIDQTCPSLYMAMASISSVKSKRHIRPLTEIQKLPTC
jgi:hypothetical protein